MIAFNLNILWGLSRETYVKFQYSEILQVGKLTKIKCCALSTYRLKHGVELQICAKPWEKKKYRIYLQITFIPFTISLPL